MKAIKTTTNKAGKPLAFAILTALNASIAIATEQSQTFHIPPQRLSGALNDYAETTNVQLSYPAAQASELRSNGVDGDYTPQQALQQLLTGTGLSAKQTANGTLTLAEQGGLMNVAGTNQPESSDSDATLPKVTVEADAESDPYDPVDTAKPYNKSYAASNARTATKTDTPIMETPVSIQVIPRAVMDDQQAISVGDAVKNISGVQPGGYVFYDNFTIRGFDAGLSTYRNGLRSPYLTFLETANLDRIEVLKGPGSVLFGRLEPGGLINLSTKRPLEQAYYSIQQQFGSYDLYRTTIDATGPILQDKSLLYRMNFAYKDNNTFRDFIHQDHVFFAPSLTWQPTEKFEANLDLEYQYDEFVEDGSDSGIPAIGNRPAPIPISRYLGDAVANRKNPNKQDKILVGGNWNYRFNDDWKLTNRFHIINTDYHQTIIYPTGYDANNPNILNRGLWHTPLHRETYGTNLDLTGHFKTGILTHDVLVGFDYNSQESHDGPGFSGDTPVVTPINIFNPSYGIDLSSITSADDNFYFNFRDNWYGLYFQDQITVFDKLHILGGGRQDWAEYGSGFSTTSFSNAALDLDRESHFSPRVGVLYQPWPWLSIYGNYVENFGVNNGRLFGGGVAKPQIAHQYEAGIKGEWFDGRLNATLAYFDLTKTNVLATDPDHLTYSKAIGEVNSSGVEFDIAGKVTDNLSLIGNYAYTEAKITKDLQTTYDGNGEPIGTNPGNTGHLLASVPKHSGSLWAKYELNHGALEGLSFGTGVYVRGLRQGDNANSFQVPGYARWDASIGYGFKYAGSKITAQLNVYNLLDQKYYDHSNSRFNVRAGDPLTFLGSVRVEF